MSSHLHTRIRLALIAVGALSAAALSGCSSAADSNAASTSAIGPPPATPSPYSSSASTLHLPNYPFSSASPPLFPSRPQLPSLPASAPSPPHYDWSIPTGAPVRTAPVSYGAWITDSPTDLIAFAVDDYKPGTITSPGIAAATAPTSIANWSSLTAAQQTEAEQSTVFLLTNLYAPTPTLLGWSNTASASFKKDAFGLSSLEMSFDPSNLELYALSQAGNVFCWDMPSPQSSTSYAASQVGPLATCAGWPTTGSTPTRGRGRPRRRAARRTRTARPSWAPPRRSAPRSSSASPRTPPRPSSHWASSAASTARCTASTTSRPRPSPSRRRCSARRPAPSVRRAPRRTPPATRSTASPSPTGAPATSTGRATARSTRPPSRGPERAARGRRATFRASPGPAFTCGSGSLQCFTVTQFCSQVTSPHGAVFYDCIPAPSSCWNDVSCACIADAGEATDCFADAGEVFTISVEP